MYAFWKWLAVAGCGVALVVAADRLSVVRADDAESSARQGSGDALDRLDRIVEKLDRVVDRMGRGGPPGRPPRDDDRPEHGGMRRGPHPHGPHHGPGPMWGELPPEMRERMERRLEELPPEARERAERRMEEGRARMDEMKARMEQARKKFREMEERIDRLEAEVERLKADG